MMWTLWLSACWQPTSRNLELEGIQLEIPYEYVDFEAQELEQIRQAALAQAPNQTVQVRAARHPEGTQVGAVNIQHSIDPDVSRYGATVKGAFDTLEADLKRELMASGLEVLSFQGAPRDGGREICNRFRLPMGETSVVMWQCVLATVDPAWKMHLRTLSCGSLDEQVCLQIMTSRKYAPGESQPAETRLPTVQGKGMPGVAGTQAWGVTFGGSVATFRAACAAAGNPVDAFDWRTEGPVVKEWFDKGRVSMCDGAVGPMPPQLGKVVRISAMFDAEDHLVSASWFLAVPPDGVEETVFTAWPEGIENLGHAVHFVNQNAQGDQVMTAAVGHTQASGARSIVTLMSHRGQTTKF